MDGFDEKRYEVLKLDNIQSELQIEEMKHKYGNRLVAYRYLVSEGKAEFLIVKEKENEQQMHLCNQQRERK